MNTTFPAPLKKGDTIAFCSPAGPVDAKKVHNAAQVLRHEGFNVVIMPHALGHHGNYSGTDGERLQDLKDAFLDPNVRAIICSRGGYGVVHIIDRLNQLPLADDPKWVVGFSDISAMHALMASKGVASVHASMAEHIALGADDPDNRLLLDILQGQRPAISFPASTYDRPGIATGPLLGGNVAVLADLIGTRYDILRPGTILFIEDVAEPIYKIERIMYQLRIAGVLGQLNGLMVGQFTDYRPDASYTNMYQMISDMVQPYAYPVAFNVPVGHVDHNVPLIEGAQVTLKVTTTGQNYLIYQQAAQGQA